MKIYKVAVKELVDIDKNKYQKRDYLTEAISPTDAEAKLTKHFEGSLVDFEVVGASETNFVEYVVIESDVEKD